MWYHAATAIAPSPTGRDVSQELDAVPHTPFAGWFPAEASTTFGQVTAVCRRGISAPDFASEQGQTLVEFALVLPILLVLVIGIFDFGSAFNSKNDLNFLANTAARYAEVDTCAPCNGQTIASYVQSTADTGQLSNSVSISFCLPALPGGATNNGSVGNPLQVTATTQFPWLSVNLPGLPKGGTSPLTSTVIVRILQSPTDTKLFSPAPPAAC